MPDHFKLQPPSEELRKAFMDAIDRTNETCVYVHVDDGAQCPFCGAVTEEDQG